MTKEHTLSLWEQHLMERGLSKQYAKGYVDALLDVYNLIKFAAEVDITFSDRP